MCGANVVLTSFIVSGHLVFTSADPSSSITKSSSSSSSAPPALWPTPPVSLSNCCMPSHRSTSNLQKICPHFPHHSGLNPGSSVFVSEHYVDSCIARVACIQLWCKAAHWCGLHLGTWQTETYLFCLSFSLVALFSSWSNFVASTPLGLYPSITSC